MNITFPIKRHEALKQPIFLNGVRRQNYGSKYEEAISAITKTIDPRINSIPPAEGLTLVRVGQ